MKKCEKVEEVKEETDESNYEVILIAEGNNQSSNTVTRFNGSWWNVLAQLPVPLNNSKIIDSQVILDRWRYLYR